MSSRVERPSQCGQKLEDDFEVEHCYRWRHNLTGLPPTPEEIEEFAKDKRPEAYAELVDRLLTSSQYGERWGRHWLDVVRYADTGGFEVDHV